MLGPHALPMGWQTGLPRILGHLLLRDSASLSLGDLRHLGIKQVGTCFGLRAPTVAYPPGAGCEEAVYSCEHRGLGTAK